MAELKMVPCKGCGRPLVWVKDEKGTKHPLDPIAPVYFITGHTDAGTPIAKRNENAYVSHFATCSKAREFSGRNR